MYQKQIFQVAILSVVATCIFFASANATETSVAGIYIPLPSTTPKPLISIETSQGKGKVDEGRHWYNFLPFFRKRNKIASDHQDTKVVVHEGLRDFLFKDDKTKPGKDAPTETKPKPSEAQETTSAPAPTTTPSKDNQID